MDTLTPVIPTNDEIARMSWYARMQLERRLNGRPRPADAPIVDELAAKRRTRKKAQPAADASDEPERKPMRRHTFIRRIEPGLWEVTNGASTAWTFSAQAAWNLVASADRKTA